MQQKELRERARKLARGLGKVEAESDRISIECAPGQFVEGGAEQPQRYRTQVMVRRFLAEITVRLDADTRQLTNWLIPTRYKGATETTITAEQAKQLALQVIELPDEAEMEELFQVSKPDSHITNIAWRHVVNGIEVEGDFITVQINSKTQQFIAMTRIWNDVRDREDKISAGDAESIARREAPNYAEAEEYDILVLDQRFIPVVIDESAAQPRAEIVKVWLVNITEPDPDFPRTTTLSIDCVTGKIVRVGYSK